MLAIEALLLDHVPPETALAKVVVVPGHTDNVPVTGAEEVPFTDTTSVAADEPQALAITYDIVALPVAMPVTTPALLTVATLVFVLYHAPPPVALARADVPPMQTVAVPVIEPSDGVVFTVIAFVAVAVPQPLETV